MDHYGLEYTTDGNNNPLTTITDPLGSKRNTHFKTVLGVLKPTDSDQPAGSGCSLAASNIEYNETTGNVISRTDFNRHKACYKYDVDDPNAANKRNLETVRIEGLDTNNPDIPNCDNIFSADLSAYAPVRKITTEWHPNYRLPTKIAEPLKLTLNNYDASGNLLTHSEQATTDKTGSAGLNPVVQGTARVWTYTYNAFGQLTKEDGPRNPVDALDVTDYEYYAGHHSRPHPR